MKKAIIILAIFLLTACKNENTNNEYLMYCNYQYDNYEEYIDISYSDNILNYINYSYLFKENIKDKDKLESYLNNFNAIDYEILDNEINLLFNNINEKDYKNIKNYLIKNYGILKDDFSYFDKGNILFNLFSSYIKDYSCD